MFALAISGYLTDGVPVAASNIYDFSGYPLSEGRCGNTMLIHSSFFGQGLTSYPETRPGWHETTRNQEIQKGTAWDAHLSHNQNPVLKW